MDLVDLYMCRIKDPSSESEIEYLVQLFDSISIAALCDILIMESGYVVECLLFVTRVYPHFVPSSLSALKMMRFMFAVFLNSPCSV